MRNRREFSLPVQVTAFIGSRLAITTMHRMVYPFLSYFGRGLGVDLHQMSYAMTARYLLGFLTPFLASVSDSRGRKTGILLGMALYTAGVSLVVFWPVYSAFFVALALTSSGYLIFIPSMQAYLGDRVPYQRRGLVLSLSELSWSLSSIIGVPFMGWMIARAGWMAPFPLLAILGVLSIAFLTWLVPHDQPQLEKRLNLWANLKVLFRSRLALTALLMAGLYGAANETVTFVYGVWVEDSFAFQITSLGATALGIGVAELLAEGIASGILDRIGKRRAIAIGVLVNALSALSLLWWGKWLPGALAGLFFFFLSFEFAMMGGISLMSEILPPARATMMASHMAVLALGRAVADLLAPVLFTQPWLPGITGNALGAVAFDLLALLVLTRVTIP